MTVQKYTDLIKTLKNVEDINKELFLAKKELLNLRIQKALNKQIKPHLFKLLKRRISQLNFKLSTI